MAKDDTTWQEEQVELIDIQERLKAECKSYIIIVHNPRERENYIAIKGGPAEREKMLKALIKVKGDILNEIMSAVFEDRKEMKND